MNRFCSASLTLACLPLTALGTLALTGGDAGASSKTITVKAVETEYHIALSTKTFKAGNYVFDVANKGHVTHALEITGPGLKNAATADLSPGKSTTLKVTLTGGKYDVFCPVPGHKMLGMNADIKVTGHATAASSTTKTTTPSGGAVSY